MSSSSKPRKPTVTNIGGIPIEFPFQPYGSQLSFMTRVIATLDRAQRDGHFHALLESPTGTGKSLSLLCSVIAWQKNNKAKSGYGSVSHSKADPEAMADPIGHGGGFVPEPDPSGNMMPTLSDTNSMAQKMKRGPVIYYATRTHSQISQVIGEFRKTNYHVPMAVLGSRKRYCTNSNVRGQDNIDEKCQKLSLTVRFNRNAPKIRAHPSVRKGGCYEVHDIEDLVKVGEMVQGCSYFGAQAMAEVADIVFCPYNYIINPQIRKAMEISVKGNIIILDEAHNIEDIARDAGSIDVEEDVLFPICINYFFVLFVTMKELQTELDNLCESDRVAEADQLGIYKPLYEMIEGIISWIRRRKKSLGKHSFQHTASCWTADKALRELEEASISKQCFPSLQECATQAIRIAADADPEVDHLSGMASTVLEGILFSCFILVSFPLSQVKVVDLIASFFVFFYSTGLFSSLTYFFSENGIHICDYQLALQCQTIKSEAGLAAEYQLALQCQTIKSEAGLAAEELPCTFSLWCLNPSLVFKNMADASLSVILTSGTLSPMSSFQSELGVQFGTSLEAPHVINVDSQLWAGVIHSGPNHYPLNASYKTSESFDFQDALGASLEEICKVVPGGCLVFFPSYKLMDKLRNRWSKTGQWKRLNAQKPVCVEPRGAQEDFENVLKDYYDTIRQGNKPTTTGRRRGKKVDASGCSATTSKGNIKKGATFLAVCRGKIIVGIPFPNVYDIKVSEKKKYNDTYKSSKGLLSGNEWYCQQAFRALNQAAGRCIRHRLDYGAIIFLADERFRQERNLAYLSKWLRNSIRQYDDFGQSLEGLKAFFRDIKVESKASSVQQGDVKPIDVDESKSCFTEIKNPKVTKINPKGSNGVAAPPVATKINKCSVPTKKYDCSLLKTESKGPEERSANKSEKNTGAAYIDLETKNRCSSPPSINISDDDFVPTVVAETPNYSESLIMKKEPFNEAYSTTVESVSEVDFTHSTIIQTKFPHQQVPHSFTSPCSTSASAFTTPKKQQISHNRSPLYSSVNSHVHKRRKASASVTVKMEQYDSPDPKEINKFSVPQSCILDVPEASSTTCGDVTQKELKISCSLCRHPLGLVENNYLVSCSVTSLSMVHLATIWKGIAAGPTSVPVVVSDISLVDRRILERTSESGIGQGIWSKEDGCVFNTIFCTFCSNQDSCLGLHVVATDSANVQFLNKLLFYSDRLEIQNIEASMNSKEVSPSSVTSVSKSPEQHPFEKFAYVPPETNSSGWRTTKSKMRLPKRVQVSTANIDA
ncbi:RAD3-like DNA-binding helicase protein [Artemisia annua]|uniref:Regulator of telomere elongation helicase 1 homolog n=1 Tax=Artemisia annua TaxID=35608 RepID=A0A2U1PTR7_ARTAN|nr:RAD3-like DNA-binding helicase protein [Artemisia annua]